MEREWEARLAELRRAFDESFALPENAPARERESYLVARVGADRLALPVRELGGVVTRRAIVPLPADAPALMGVIGDRGRPVPVLAVGVLLGRAPAPAEPWILLTSARSPVGLAVDALDEYLELPSGAIAGTIATAAGPVEVLDVPALCGAGPTDSTK